MLLAIDVGNTNTVLGLYRLAGAEASPKPSAGGKEPLEDSSLLVSGDKPAPELLAHWRVTTPRTVTADEIGVLLRDLFSLRSLSLADVTGVIVASVVPPIDSTLRRRAGDLLPREAALR